MILKDRLHLFIMCRMSQDHLEWTEFAEADLLIGPNGCTTCGFSVRYFLLVLLVPHSAIVKKNVNRIYGVTCLQ